MSLTAPSTLKLRNLSVQTKKSIKDAIRCIVQTRNACTSTTRSLTCVKQCMKSSTNAAAYGHYEDDYVDKQSYIMPENYNLSQVVEEIKNGNGFCVLKKAISRDDIEEAKALVNWLTMNKRVDTNTDRSYSGRHNSYGGEKRGGIIWSLLGKGEVFAKLAQHPAILEITRALLGPKSQISSYASNTVLPGMGAQLPHMDYPYYDGFFPPSEEHIQRPLLSVAFMMMLSDFTKENGGTAFRSGSQRQPSYPHDKEDFYRNMVQLEGEAGDIGVFAASTQHCAIANMGTEARVGIVQSMTPVYLKPYHDIKLPLMNQAEVPEELRRILALDHPYPMAHG